MRHFIRTVFFRLENHDRTHYIPPLGKFEYTFEVPERSWPVEHRIRLTGEADYYWKWRAEWGSPDVIAMCHDDLLTTVDTFHEKFAMEFISRKEDFFPRSIYTKIIREDLCPGENYRLSIPVKMENFHLRENGEASAVLEIYHAREDRHPNDVYDAPDEIVHLPFESGSRDWNVAQTAFQLHEKAVCILFRLGLRNAEGKFRIGSPKLTCPGKDSVLPPLARTQSLEHRFNYLTENVSRRDWLECRVEIDGREIFDGEKYTSIVRRPEFTFRADTLAPGKHTFTLILQNNYENAVGFLPSGLELQEFGKHDFELVAAPETIQEGRSFAVLLQINRPCLTVSASGTAVTFPECGLHGLKLPPLDAEEKKIICSCESWQDSFTIRKVPAQDYPIFLGTGDSIFIPQTIEDMDLFLEWYLHENIGNCVCFRHAYRWGGGRALNVPLWKHTIALLNELEMHYSLMVDGREVPGMSCNPPESLLEGPFYIGRRSHENDGAFCYWGSHNLLYETVKSDIYSRGADIGGIYPHIRPARKGYGNGGAAPDSCDRNDMELPGENVWLFFDPTRSRDMKESAEYFVHNLAISRGESWRHSGPSVLFRYLFQAGYRCLLAEQMYGPEEVILSALRGASRAWRKRNYGTHLATQWSSLPHDTPEHAWRYFLSLAISYLHGATEINTEEGLWRMECNYVDFDRFSNACQLHQDTHRIFRRFLETHPRNGILKTPLACIQGRYDGWRCFGRGNTWMNAGDEWKFGFPEESFDLLKVFFPRSFIGPIGRRPCPIAPQGWYTGTPYGYIDIAPFETDWSQYDAIAFLGWHTYQTGDGEKMLEYVRQGGLFLLGRRHLSTTLKRGEFAIPEQDASLDILLGDSWRTATGIFRRKIGRGFVIFFASDCWPAEMEIRAEYEQALRNLAEKCSEKECRKAWIEANDDVEFAAYDQSDGSRIFYLLNIRWWDRADSAVILHSGAKCRKITVPFGNILMQASNL